MCQGGLWIAHRHDAPGVERHVARLEDVGGDGHRGGDGGLRRANGVRTEGRPGGPFPGGVLLNLRCSKAAAGKLLQFPILPVGWEVLFPNWHNSIF